MINECEIKTYLNEYILGSISNVIIQYIKYIKGDQIKFFPSKIRNYATQTSKLMEGNIIKFCMVDDYLHKISLNDEQYTLTLFRIMVDNSEKEREEYDKEMYETKINKRNYTNCVRVDDKMYIKYIHEHKIVCADKIKIISKIAVSKIRNEVYLLAEDRDEIYVFTFTGAYLRQFTLLTTNFNIELYKPYRIIPHIINNYRPEFYKDNYTSMVLSNDENEIFVSDYSNYRVMSINPITGELLYEFMLEQQYSKRPMRIALYNNEIFVACINDDVYVNDDIHKYNTTPECILVYDKTTRKKLRQINTSVKYGIIAIIGDSIYLQYVIGDHFGYAIRYVVHDVNEKCESYITKRNNYHTWGEYNSTGSICCNDGLIGIYHGKAFVLSETYWHTALHIFI